MIPIIDRYFLQEIGKTLLAILLVLVLIFLGFTLIRMLKEVSAGALQSTLLFRMIVLELLRLMGGLVAPAYFFAILYAVGRMYRDSEMTALESCGVGGGRLLRAILIAALPVLLLVGWLSMVIAPWASSRIDQLVVEQQGEAGALAGINPGRFNEYTGGRLVVYVESFDNTQQQMHDIFVQHWRKGQSDVISARLGYQKTDLDSGDRFLVLEDGYRHQGNPGEANYRISQFGRYALRIEEAQGMFIKKPWRSVTNQELLASSDIRYRVEFQHRISQLLALVAVSLMGFHFSRSSPRQSPFGRLVWALIFYALYLGVQGASEQWMTDGITPIWLGLWWVHALVLLIAIPLFFSAQLGSAIKQMYLRSSSA